MVTTIKQRVTVEAGGRIALHSPELREGESAEVIVTVDRPTSPEPSDRLRALRQLRKSLNLTPGLAAQWECEVRAERAAWGNRPIE